MRHQNQHSSKMSSMKELLKQQYEQTKNRCEIDQTYLKPGEVAIIDAGNAQNGGDGDEWSEFHFCEGWQMCCEGG